ncbi:MAG: hypothetical protein QXL14_01875 [Candidatus Aenigmatarchaeota archaeon]
MPKEKLEDIEKGSESVDAIKTIAQAIKDEEITDVAKVLEMLDKLSSQENIVKEIINMLLVQKLLEKMEDSKGKESIGETMKDMLKIILPLKMIQGLERKDDDIIKYMLIANMGRSGDRFLESLLKLEKEREEENRRKLEELTNMLRERELEAVKKEQEKQMAMVLTKLEALEDLYSRKEDVSIAEHLSKVLNEYNSIRDAVVKFAEEQGIKKEEIVTETGKINWGKILTDWGKKGLQLIEKYIEAQSRIPPAYIPPVMPQAPVEAPKETTTEAPKVEEKKKEKVEEEESYSDIVDVSIQEENKE